MVHHFNEICRKYEYFADREKDLIFKKRALQQGAKCAKKFNKIKKTRGKSLFGASHNVYDAQICYEDLETIAPSITDLIKEIFKLNIANEDEAPTLKNPRSILQEQKRYLKVYFGMEYEGEWMSKQNYQIHQLLLIIYRCAEKNKHGILSNIESASFWRFRNEQENPYKEPILFIKSELLKALTFNEAIAMEYIAGIFRFCINTLAEVTVKRVTDELDYLAQLYESEIREDLYRLILLNLKTLNGEEQPLFLESDNLFLRAYFHFLLLGVEDTSKELGIDGINLDELHRERSWRFNVLPVWKGVEEFIKNAPKKNNCINKIKNVVQIRAGKYLMPVGDFVEDRAKDIAREIWKEKFENKHYMAVRRDAHNYGKLALLYSLYNPKNYRYEVELEELLTIIHLYEKCKGQQVTYRMGYNGGKAGRKDKKFKAILGDLPEDIPNDIMIKATEAGLYEIVCFMNTLNSLLANDSERTVKDRVEIKTELFVYLKKVIPMMEFEGRKYKTLTDIAESIISTEELKKYCLWKEKKTQMELFGFLHSIEGN